MARPKGTKNKDNSIFPKEFKEAIKPQEMKLNMEDLKKEIPTDSKTVANHDTEVSDTEGKGISGIPGIGPVTAEKLRALGYGTLISIATGRADEIGAEMKVGYPQAKAWVTYAQEKVLAKMTMKNAVEQDKDKKSKQVFLQTGSQALNKLLGGGIASMSSTGLSGRFATGKTQICNEAIIDCLSRLKEKAVYIETEPDSFHLDRLKQMAKLKGVECNWEDLYVCPADQIPTAKAQFLQYKLVQKKLEAGEKIRLIVVDSFNAKFRAGYSRTEMLPVRTREFAEHFQLMEYLEARYNTAWLLTCQTIAAPRPDQGLGNMMKFGDQFYPVGGDLVLHSISTWLALTQIKVELWKATLYDSSYLPRETVEFCITAKGIVDSVK
jgi:DNA repair protein RadA